MKRILSLFLLFCTLITFFACKPDAETPEPNPDSSSPIENIQKPDPEPSSEPEPEPEPEPLSYEEYFSVERSFDWLGSIGAHTLKDLGHVTTAQTVPKEDGYIYFIRDYTEIVRVDEEGKNEDIIYESDSNVILEEIYVDGPVMFFREDDAIMRMYLPDKTVDRLMVVPNFPAMTPDEARADVERFGSAYYAPQNWYRPISTTDFAWEHPDTNYYEYEGDEPQGTTFAFSALTNESYPVIWLMRTGIAMSNAFFQKYEIYYGDVRITDWRMLKEDILLKRADRYPHLDKESAYDSDEATFAAYSQYLKERGEDLEAMGKDPHEVSLFRYPEDDFYIDQWFDLED